jgi:hypothetical protein
MWAAGQPLAQCGSSQCFLSLAAACLGLSHFNADTRPDSTLILVAADMLLLLLLLLFSDDDDDESVAMLQRVLLHYVNRRKAADRKRAEREFQVGWGLGGFTWCLFSVSRLIRHLTFAIGYVLTCSC